MVLGGRPPGRVGRRRISTLSPCGVASIHDKNAPSGAFLPFSARRVHLTRFSALVATGCRICAGTLVGLKPYAERAAPSQLAFQRSQYQWRSLRQWQRSGERRWRPPESPGRREWCRSAQPAEWRRPVRRWRQVVGGPLRRRRAQAGQRSRWRRCTWRLQQVRYQPAFGRRRSNRARWRPPACPSSISGITPACPA